MLEIAALATGLQPSDFSLHLSGKHRPTAETVSRLSFTNPVMTDGRRRVVVELEAEVDGLFDTSEISTQWNVARSDLMSIAFRRERAADLQVGTG